MTASPAELRLLLFEGAIRFAEQARRGMEAKDYEQVHNGITRCQDIVMELVNSLRPEHNPELCDKLAALYVFIYTRLMNASSQRDITLLDEALELLRYERDTWAMVLEKLAAENHRAGSTETTSLPTPTPTDKGQHADGVCDSSLVGGRVSIKG